MLAADMKYRIEESQCEVCTHRGTKKSPCPIRKEIWRGRSPSGYAPMPDSFFHDHIITAGECRHFAVIAK